MTGPAASPGPLLGRLRGLAPLGRRVGSTSRRLLRRLFGQPRTVTEAPNLLPLLIRVLAAFSKTGTDTLEEEVDSSLGFLRYDYPDAVYSELRRLFRQALNEQHDLDALADQLAGQLESERKIMLGVQLFDLISRAGLKREQIANYYAFMTRLGLAAQAIDIVYQLNASGDSEAGIYQRGVSPLESLVFSSGAKAEVHLKSLDPDERLLAFRYQDLILLKNHCQRPVVVRGRPLQAGQFCRVYSGQRIIVGEQVLTHQDLVYYFNAKKNVSITTSFLTIDRNDEVVVERARSRDSCLEVTFGLKVQVRALRSIDAVLNGTTLRAGTTVEATLEDTIIFHSDSELPLIDVRRRARALGSRFQLKAHKSTYLVSNNPGLLGQDDILLSPGTGGEVLLRITCDYNSRTGSVEVLQADRPIMVGDTPVRNSAQVADGDAIRIDAGQLLRCNFSERIIEEERNIIRQFEARDLSHRFRHAQPALDGVSFSVHRGEMVCVMGASGAGKSTLMRTLAGQLAPERGSVQLNGESLYDNHLDRLKRFIAYIPQDDAFDEHLTIEENLALAAALRAPHLSARERLRRIEGRLVELGLSERRHSVVGSPTRKVLSGGERKRLNIGLDMIGSADVFLFDEPTSGLSSKDAEHVVEIIRGIAHNKIVLVTIHQPTSKIFQMFNKAMLLDRGGKLVFFGTPQEMLAYFARAEHEQQFGTELGGCPACGTTRPEFIFDVLETPLRDLSGDIIFEENSQSQLVPARRFSPEYWRDKWESFRLLQDVQQVAVRKTPAAAAPPQPSGGREPFRWRDQWTCFRVILKRAFVSKLRNRANLLTTIVEAPLLAGLISAVLRYSESGQYDFASAYHIPTYLFLMLIVSMFLGLTNSADDIIRDRAILQRERNLNVRLSFYVTAKTLTLALFAAVQCALFILIGNGILEVRGMFWTYFGFNFITALTGIAIGLLISSLVPDAKTAANIVPLVLIPQIILGGALIKYEEMNRDLDVLYRFSRWFVTHPDDDKNAAKSKLQVPLICELIPMRWSYEALVVAQAKNNPLALRQRHLQLAIEKIIAGKNRTPAAAARLEDLKDTLALLSGLEAGSPDEIDRRLDRVDAVLAGTPLKAVKLHSRTSGVTAESLYVNQKIADLIAKAETEQADYRRARRINVFFGPEKIIFDAEVSVLAINLAVLGTFFVGTLAALYDSLRRQVVVRRR